MAKRMPTQVGDVLILTTDKTFSTHAVGLVSEDGQEDFHTQSSLKYLADRAAAVAAAKALVMPGRRIFCRNLDTGDWSEISK